MIVVAGEALVDLVEEGGMLRAVPGGGPFNTAIALGRLGLPVAYLGTLSRDDYGGVLAGLLSDASVDLWKTLRVWSEQFRQGVLDPTSTSVRFLIHPGHESWLTQSWACEPLSSPSRDRSSRGHLTKGKFMYAKTSSSLSTVA